MTNQRFLRQIATSATFGAILFGYDTGVINGALPTMSRPDQLNLDAAGQGVVTSSLLFGAAIGAFTGGRLADRYGRRRLLMVLAVVFLLGTIGAALSPDMVVISGFRFILGLAVGGASVTVPAYLAEMAPTDERGRFVTRNELMIVSGQLLAFVMNAILMVSFTDQPGIWRWMLSVAALPAIALFISMARMPESPRWLVMKGYTKRATEVLIHIHGDKAPEELALIEAGLAENKSQNSQWHLLKVSWFRRVLLIAIGIAMLNQLGGVNAVMYYGTQILTDAGFSSNAAIVANIANGVISVAATFGGIYLMKRFGVRQLLFAGFASVMVVHLLIGVTSAWLPHQGLFPYWILLMTVLFMLFNQGMIAPTTWLLLSEVFPQTARGFGMGIAVLVMWLTNFAIGLFVPSLLANIGLSGTFYLFAGVALVALIFIRQFVPETSGESLEEIEADFRGDSKPVAVKKAHV
ncbi:MAG TPA: sugar porter family MFS transporter [Lactobacillaceae bacterium]|jgi:major inositol transporter-like SP family MFS transporter